jgi:hypothetical protein
MARKKTVKEQPNTTPEQAVEELSTIDQGLFPEGHPENPLINPTEAVEEESTETKADVLETDKIAVIEVQEATGVNVGGDVEEFFKEQEIIETDCPLLDNIINPTNGEEELINLIDSMETSPDQEDEEDNYTETDEDGDGIPEHYVFDWSGKPVAATLMHIRETKINSLVEKVMFASYLGGELHKNGVQLNRVPYRANVLIPTSKVCQWVSEEGKLEYEEGFNYTPVTVKGISAHLFLKRIMEVSKKGAVITPLKRAMNNNGYLVSLLCKAPVAQSASFQLAAQKPIYTLDDLRGMGAESLKVVCGWHGLKYKGKVQARIDILEYYKGKENG